MLVRMKRSIAFLALLGTALLTSCSKPETAEAPKTATESPSAATPTGGGPHAIVHLNDGSKVPGTVVASTQTDMVVDGDDGIERKIPLDKVKNVEYGAAKPSPAQAQAPKQTPAKTASNRDPEPVKRVDPTPVNPEPVPPPAPAPPPPVTTKTNELPVGAEVSVRTNEPIDSSTAAEGQTFDAQVTRTIKDSDGDVVIPKGAPARIIIKSATKGGKFRGQSDLVLDLQSVVINGRSHQIETADLAQKGKAGVGANTRTAEHVGGGAALGAIIGAIAGGGHGAAMGAGAGAGAGAIGEVLTKGGSIKVPAETVLRFRLERPLRVVAE